MSPDAIAPALSAALAAVLWLVIAGALATLSAALLVSQEAGLERLEEKYPAAARAIERHRPRWDVLRFAVYLAAALALVPAVRALLRAGGPQAGGPAWAVAAGLIVAALGVVLVMGVLPRSLAEGYADLISMRFLPVAIFFSWVLFPLAAPLARLEQLLLHWTRSEADEEDRPSHEEEILYLVEHASNEDLEDDERELIRSVFDFGETMARESMTPRVEVEGLDETLSVTAACERIAKSAHSRFPVYHQTIDQVRGLVHAKDLLRLLIKGEGALPIGEVAKRVTFVPEDMLISELLQLLRSEKSQLAVVVDEYGGTAGVITVEDILEELVGDIHDEYDEEGNLVQRAPDGSLVLDVRIPVDRANRVLGTTIPESADYDSLGGFIYERLGRIPRPGESLTVDGLQITVRTADARRIETVKVARAATGEDP